MKIINGRVKLNWKKRNKTDIIREINKKKNKKLLIFFIENYFQM